MSIIFTYPTKVILWISKRNVSKYTIAVYMTRCAVYKCSQQMLRGAVNECKSTSFDFFAKFAVRILIVDK